MGPLETNMDHITIEYVQMMKQLFSFNILDPVNVSSKVLAKFTCPRFNLQSSLLRGFLRNIFIYLGNFPNSIQDFPRYHLYPQQV